jgi:pullulanase/glycogen debranching enzyme
VLFRSVADLAAPELQPAGWGEIDVRRPPLAHACDSVLYELHVRDFSAADESVPAALRGTFRALALPNSHGGRHLAALAAAGVTHIHLLPVFDFGSVDELRETWREPRAAADLPLSSLPPDSEAQQAAVTAVADVDGFNWGYDPVHWGVPDGSYCTQPDGASRTLELREAVCALHTRGLRVVLDVVYNHVYGAGPTSPHAVLDTVVPGYYLRRDERGEVVRSSPQPAVQLGWTRLADATLALHTAQLDMHEQHGE